VGSARRGLGLEAGGYFFVGPDNGIFTFVLASHSGARVHALTNAGLFRYRVSPTFHARDVFGPVAGHLARGLPLDQVGPPAERPVLLPTDTPRRVGNDWATTVLMWIFGNLAHLRPERRILDKVGEPDAGHPAGRASCCPGETSAVKAWLRTGGQQRAPRVVTGATRRGSWAPAGARR
jgi:hypothetical protein